MADAQRMSWRQALDEAQARGDLAAMELACRRGLIDAPGEVFPTQCLSELLLTTNRVAEALAFLRVATTRHPEVAPLFVTLAVSAATLGELDLAVRSAARAATLDAQNADIAALYGELLLQDERPAEAIAPLRLAVALRTNDGTAWANLGLALARSQQDAAAVEAFDVAREHLEEPDQVAVASAEALGRLERTDEACRLLAAAVDRHPQDAELWGEFGNALARSERWAPALSAYVHAVGLEPARVSTRLAAATALDKVGRSEEALTVLQELLTRPDLTVEQRAWAWDLIGVARLSLGDKPGAAAAFEAALGLDQRPARYHAHLAAALLPREAGRARASLEAAIARDPEGRATYLLLGNALKEQGRIDEAQTAYREAMTRHRGHQDAHSNLIYSELFRADVTPERVLENHRAWSARHVVSTPPPPERSRFSAGRSPLRLGIVSSDLRSHPVGYFTIRTFEALAHMPVDVTVYSTQRPDAADPLTRRFAAAVRQFRSSAGMSDDEMAAVIRNDGVQVLFDLAGHCAGHRLQVFARRPAPLQVSWAGYMATTGLSAMDVLLADRHHVPPGDERYYVERVERMPDAFIAYDPPQPLPELTPPPSGSGGAPTFGAFHILAKVTDEVLTVWSAVLERVPGSRLLWKTSALDCAETRALVGRRLRAAGIDPGRVELRGHTGLTEHMAALSEIDVALDSFPFSGSTTTLETMLMGVPVVTWPGRTFSSRHSLAFLSTVGFTDTIARSADEYVQIAVDWATQPARLKTLRGTLRRQMLQSPMCDGVSHARALEKLLLELLR